MTYKHKILSNPQKIGKFAELWVEMQWSLGKIVKTNWDDAAIRDKPMFLRDILALRELVFLNFGSYSSSFFPKIEGDISSLNAWASLILILMHEMLRSLKEYMDKDKDFVPLKVGIHKQLKRELGLSFNYLRSHIAGVPRYNLAGEQEGLVTKAQAQTTLARLEIALKQEVGDDGDRTLITEQNEESKEC